MEGSCTVAGDLLTLTKVKETADGDAETTEDIGKDINISKFQVMFDGSLAKLDEDGKVDKIQGGRTGEKEPAILKNK